MQSRLSLQKYAGPHLSYMLQHAHGFVAVEQLFEAIVKKREGRGFDSD
jgi:hypothetical protein